MVEDLEIDVRIVEGNQVTEKIVLGKTYTRDEWKNKEEKRKDNLGTSISSDTISDTKEKKEKKPGDVKHGD